MKPKRNRVRVQPIQALNSCRYSFVKGAYFEVTGDLDEEYRVQFIDIDRDEIVHEGVITNNQWIRATRSYFTNWHTRVSRQSDNALVFDHRFDCSRQKVYIAFESKALGDTLAWFPAVEEFKKRHDCDVICSTFMNDLFQDAYPDLGFVEPGTTVENLYAMYSIGWFCTHDGDIDYSRHPNNFREQPLSKTAFDILGLPYQEIRPKLSWVSSDSPFQSHYVCIAFHATAQAKYWNNPKGWEEVVSFIREKGYEVVLLSREGMEYMGNDAPRNVIELQPGKIDNILNYLRHAKLFIGVGSGLSWLAWAVGCPMCLISGFSYAYTEIQGCIRIGPTDSFCSGCFNRYKMDPSDWNWCPDHKGTPRMFECSAGISGAQVIQAIEPYLE